MFSGNLAQNTVNTIKDESKSTLEKFFDVCEKNDNTILSDFLKNIHDAYTLFNSKQELYLALKKAMSCNHSDLILWMIKHGLNLEDPDLAPLQTAIDLEKVDMVKILLDNGAKTETLLLGSTPLRTAISKGNLAITQLLLDYGANIEANYLTTTSTPLHLAITLGDIETVKILLENKANVNATAILNINALHLAAGIGRIDIVQLLLEKGATMVPTVFNNNAIQEALATGHIDIAKLLTDKCIKDNNLRTFLTSDLKTNPIFQLLRYLIERAMKPQFTRTTLFGHTFLSRPILIFGHKLNLPKDEKMDAAETLEKIIGEYFSLNESARSTEHYKQNIRERLASYQDALLNGDLNRIYLNFLKEQPWQALFPTVDELKTYSSPIIHNI